ncbi:hypothetical protein ACMHYB_54975 [Sorangium sp. So ce1128]
MSASASPEARDKRLRQSTVAQRPCLAVDRLPAAPDRMSDGQPAVGQLALTTLTTGDVPSPDPHLLVTMTIRHYRSFMPMTQEARKPMFLLEPADGAIGSHAAAVQDCRRDFEALARRIAAAASIPLAAYPA